jgi:hypothetical protein
MKVLQTSALATWLRRRSIRSEPAPNVYEWKRECRVLRVGSLLFDWELES